MNVSDITIDTEHRVAVRLGFEGWVRYIGLHLFEEINDPRFTSGVVADFSKFMVSYLAQGKEIFEELQADAKKRGRSYPPYKETRMVIDGMRTKYEVDFLPKPKPRVYLRLLE